MQSRLRISLLSALMMALAGQPADAAEEEVVQGITAWEGVGQIVPTSEQDALFVGSFRGILFLARKEGTLDAAIMTCPGVAELNLQDGSQKGEGRCVIVTSSGDRVFAKWDCVGVQLTGCSGTFTLTGGTGKLKGITGESPFLIRSAINRLAASKGTASVEEAAAGIAFLNELKYKIP
ncbi:MAG: hypothetical protein QNJ94_06205 [Alphaproteobacteria bacterium]|nr:hypothetical protein [Alphaproteobacteria bacterium]